MCGCFLSTVVYDDSFQDYGLNKALNTQIFADVRTVNLKLLTQVCDEMYIVSLHKMYLLS